MIAANGSMWTTSVERVMPASWSSVESDRAIPKQERPGDDAERPAPGEHGDHDRHVALALREEGLEAAGADDRQVGAAEPGERAGGERRVAAGGDDADARGVERLRLLARRPQVEADVRRAEDPGEQRGEGEAEVDDHRLAEQGNCR